MMAMTGVEAWWLRYMYCARDLEWLLYERRLRVGGVNA